MNKLFRSSLIISWELHEKRRKALSSWGPEKYPSVFISMDRNRDETWKNQYQHLTPTYCQETSRTELQQQALQHITFQIKMIRASSITNPAAKATSLSYKDCFPKVKVFSRGSKTTWSQNSPWTTGVTKPLQKSISNFLLASNNRDTKVKS